MNFSNSIFYLTICGILIACSPHPSTSSHVVPVPISTKPIGTPIDKVAVFIVHGPDTTSPIERINVWDEHAKTKGLLHIFAPVGVDVTEIKGEKHVVNIEQLSREMARVLANINANRLLIFINTHGSASGNFCYEGKDKCNLTEDPFVALLQEQSKLAFQPIKQILIIPLSCFNKPIMDRFNNKIKTLRSSFEISYMLMESETTCGSESTAINLFENEILAFTAPTESEIEEFLSLKTLQEALSFNDKLLEKIFPGDPEFKYIVNASHPIKLTDFGFALEFSIKFGDLNEPKPFPYNKSLAEVLRELELKQKYYKYINKIRFTFEDDSHVSIAVNPNATAVSNDEQYRNKKYKSLRVLLRTVNDVEADI